jgi:hypothetical protein
MATATTQQHADVGTNPYPWYDSHWLWSYTQAKRLLASHQPGRLEAFERAFEPLRTRSEFRIRTYDGLFDCAMLERLRQTIRGLRSAQLELHELPSFRRFIVHNHDLINELQAGLVDLGSEGCGERVEPCYNFLSLYRAGASCPVHMDAPEAKWTLDVCIAQSEPWPLHVSQVLPWPEAYQASEEDWQGAIRRSPGHRFASYAMEPGQALLFSGSSQWHYRDPQPAGSIPAFCDLIFFHFIPAGMAEIVRPVHWAELFGIPELASVVVKRA